MKGEMPPIFLALLSFLDCFALAVAFVVCLVVASFLFFVGFSWVVGGGSFSLRLIATKRKGRLFGLSSLSLWVVGLLYAHKLVQIIAGFIGSKISPPGCGVLYLAGSPAYFSEIAIFHGFACFIYFDFDAAPVTYCERGGWFESCHIRKLILFVVVFVFANML